MKIIKKISFWTSAILFGCSIPINILKICYGTWDEIGRVFALIIYACLVAFAAMGMYLIKKTFS